MAVLSAAEGDLAHRAEDRVPVTAHCIFRERDQEPMLN
jgi:hypothetical protein